LDQTFWFPINICFVCCVILTERCCQIEKVASVSISIGGDRQLMLDS
jgi:hypothetical protein